MARARARIVNTRQRSRVQNAHYRTGLPPSARSRSPYPVHFPQYLRTTRRDGGGSGEGDGGGREGGRAGWRDGRKMEMEKVRVTYYYELRGADGVDPLDGCLMKDA